MPASEPPFSPLFSPSTRAAYLNDDHFFRDEARDRSASSVYQNDSILLNITSRVEEKKAILNMMVASKRGFAVGAMVLYREVEVGVLGKLAEKEVAYAHLITYIASIRTLSYPNHQPLWPNDLNLHSLSQQYPALSRINFTLPTCLTQSSLELYPEPEQVKVTGYSKKATVYGTLYLALDGDEPFDLSLYSDNMALSGIDKKFFLGGLRLGSPFHGGHTNKPQILWLRPHQPLVPPRCTDHAHMVGHMADQWKTLFVRLKALVVTNGCTAEHLEAMLKAAPGLERLTFYQHHVALKSGDLSDGEDRFISSRGVLRRLLFKLDGPKELLDSVTFGTDCSFYPELSEIAECLNARHLAVRWDLNDLYRAFHAQTESIDAWRSSLQEIELHPEWESLSLWIASPAIKRNPFTAGLALSKLVPPHIKIHFYTSPSLMGPRSDFSTWVEHVKEARLYGIQLILQERGPGFHRVMPAEDVDVDVEARSPITVSVLETQSDAGESTCSEFYTPDVVESADDAWGRLSLAKKLKMLKKEGIEVVDGTDMLI